MYCTSCGSEVKESSRICHVCGSDLSAALAMADESEYEDQEDSLRTAEEIARRSLVLSSVIACAYGDKKEENVKWLKAEDLWSDVTPMEKEFLTKGGSEKQRRNLTWKIEALVPLLWAINRIDSMPALNQQCNTEPLKAAVVWPPANTGRYIETAKLRAEEELRAEHEKVYQAHWKVRDAQINGRPVPEGYDAGVVYEWHYGFNWVVGYMGQPWDDISTDT